MMPVAVETFSPWVSESLHVIGRRIALRSGDPRSISFLFYYKELAYLFNEAMFQQF